MLTSTINHLVMPAGISMRRPSRLQMLACAYVAVALVGTTALTVTLSGRPAAPLVFLLWLLFLGPLGLVVAVLSVGFGLGFAPLTSGLGPAGVVAVLLYTGAALLNVLVLRNLHRTDVRPAAPSAVAQHRTVTTVLYCCAGAGFVLLSFFCGFFFLVAYGVDVPIAEPIRIRTQVLAGTTWFIGLTAALTGLVIWVRGRRGGRSTLVWAVTDAVVIAMMTALVVVGGQVSLT